MQRRPRKPLTQLFEEMADNEVAWDAAAGPLRRRRKDEMQRINAALLRIDDGDYGYCLTCGEDIEKKRIELDPAIPTCIGCAK